jgi:flagellar P-ring protein precursor FlgI
VAQGALIVGGFEAGGAAGGGIQAGSTNTARIPDGALVEREIKTSIEQDGSLTLALKQPGFLSAARVVEAVNKELGSEVARAVDAGAVKLKLANPKDGQEAIQLLAKLTTIDVVPDTAARVVINERTGTVVAGGDVRLLPVAIAQGGITIQVREQEQVSQPGAFGTRETPRSRSIVKWKAQETVPQVAYLKGAASLAEVAQALSSFGVSPRELASILQALKAAGALRAEIVVQ